MKWFAIQSVFFLFPLVLFGQKKGFPPDIITTVDQRVDAKINESIVVGIIDENGINYYSAGKKRAGGQKVDEHSIYEIGSISKVFTATLLADQIEKGRLHTDDPIEQFLPEDVHIPTFDGQHITLGNLSDHTSSLPRMPDNFTPEDAMNPYADYTVRQMYDFLSTYTLTRPIGSEYEYSNLAVGLLGHILSLQAKMPYEELMVNTIAKPLHMDETRITLTGDMKKNLAYGHVDGQEVPNWDIPTLAGAGAIRSSVCDILKFLLAEMGSSPSELDEAMKLTQQTRHDKANGNLVGLGWHIKPGGQHDIIWHNGATGGYMTFIGFIPETHMGVAVFTNSFSSVDDIGFHLLNPNYPLKTIKPSVSGFLKNMIEKKGSRHLAEEFHSIREKYSNQYDFSENEINNLGYYYFNAGDANTAITLFKINVDLYPASSNTYDSYGEALLKNGDTTNAVVNYQKSIDLNPANSKAIDILEKLGINRKVDGIKVDTNLLNQYVGNYELVPGFRIKVTQEGFQLFAQATGQDKYEIFPKNQNEFYYKAVDAQILFKKNKEGIYRLVLHQNGQDINGRRVE